METETHEGLDQSGPTAEQQPIQRIPKVGVKRASQTGPVTCQHTGCGREFKNQWAWQVHYSQAHENKGGWKRYKGGRKPKKGKRGPYKKRNEMGVHIDAPAQINVKQEPRTAKWCPCCGVNLLAVNMALKLTHEN